MRMVQVVDDERLQTYVYNPDSPYTPLARIDQNRTVDGKVGKTQTVYHHHAHDNGQIQTVTDETGDVVWNARYTAHGTLQFAQKTDGKPFDEHLRFAGQYADDETGLHFNTFRYYDPEIGRFVSSDPIGLMGGYNLYQYAPSTTGWIDPWGWCVKTNRANGKAAEKLILDKLIKNPNVTVLGTNVSVRTANGMRYIDALIKNNTTGKIIAVEVKSGNAIRSAAQIAKDALIDAGQGKFLGGGLNSNGASLINQLTNNVVTSISKVPLWKI